MAGYFMTSSKLNLYTFFAGNLAKMVLSPKFELDFQFNYWVFDTPVKGRGIYILWQRLKLKKQQNTAACDFINVSWTATLLFAAGNSSLEPLFYEIGGQSLHSCWCSSMLTLQFLAPVFLNHFQNTKNTCTKMAGYFMTSSKLNLYTSFVGNLASLKWCCVQNLSSIFSWVEFLTFLWQVLPIYILWQNRN
jgi:hypothetical protein